MIDNEDSDSQKAADILFDARLNAVRIAELPRTLRPQNLRHSYAVQDRLNRRLASSAAGPVAGYKIGCTTEVMQAYLDIPHPCAGAMFDSTVKFGAGEFNVRKLCYPGVECEIAVQIEKDMVLDDDHEFSLSQCELYVGAVMASIELVDARWTDYSVVSTPSLIADNFFGAGCVLGRPVSLGADRLSALTGTMHINGKVIGSGRGEDILGHPYAALCWLANHQARRGQPLRAGEYVSLGSVVQTQWLQAGDMVEVEFDELGGCSLVLTADD